MDCGLVGGLPTGFPVLRGGVWPVWIRGRPGRLTEIQRRIKGLSLEATQSMHEPRGIQPG